MERREEEEESSLTCKGREREGCSYPNEVRENRGALRGNGGRGGREAECATKKKHGGSTLPFVPLKKIAFIPLFFLSGTHGAAEREREREREKAEPPPLQKLPFPSFPSPPPQKSVCCWVRQAFHHLVDETYSHRPVCNTVHHNV